MMTDSVFSSEGPKKPVEGYGKFLIQLGWTVEILAVVIGLAISVVVSYSAFKSFPQGKETVSLLEGYFAMSVASLPFVLVAVAELCKIPLTYAFMCVKNIAWRVLFLFFVFFLCLITFETMFNGFERNFSNLNRAIDYRKSEIEGLDSQIAILTRQKKYTQAFTENELMQDVSQSRESIHDTYTQKLNLLNNKTAQLMAGLNGSHKQQINTEIERLMDVRDTYYQDWKEEKRSLESRFTALLSENISGSQNERERLLAELEALKQEMARELEDSNFFTRDATETKYRALIKEKNTQLSQITSGFLGGEALEKQSRIEAELKQQIELLNQKYVGRLADVNNRIDHLRQEIVDQDRKQEELKQTIISRDESERTRLLAIKSTEEQQLTQYEDNKSSELETITSNVHTLNKKIFRLDNQRRTYRTEISHLINQNQVYRLAMYAYGASSASEVDRGMVGVVAFIWFGSLSFITAVTGVMLALAGFYLKGIWVPTSEDVPEPTRAAAPEPVPEAASQPTPEPALEPISEPGSEPTSELVPEPTPESVPEPASEPTGDAAPEPTPEPAQDRAPERTPVRAPNINPVDQGLQGA